MKAPVNKIIPFSNVDGPGNRTSIFFQGCSFKCWYCHNPETIHRCNHCGDCVAGCPVHALSIVDGKVVWDKQKCVQCDLCIHTCKMMASPKIEELEVEELIARILPMKPFIRGITVSGGECMLHAKYLEELFRKVKKLGLTCLIDSNGSIDFSRYISLMELCDGVMLDVKAYDPDFHLALCDHSNDRVIKNLHYLLETNKLQEVRTVILPKYPQENLDTVSHVAQIIQDRCDYKLLRYRPFGVREDALDKMGREIADEEECEILKKKAIELGAIHTIII
ncbi:YjjW family glycine radical enzyme activase [Traorella massiliensis]|uniref:YjjW family glycine radical enzyme activase n=1 Tax=Traorella massiliensis TaxID=1903263 RepID=UPI002357778E|nr:YjjW family glycine radical enzyme activase [Traorella massiliensis]